jgi:hypothetical protein
MKSYLFCPLLLVLGLLTLAPTASAQSYTCRDNTGRTYISLRPCPVPGLIIYGPTERAPDGSGFGRSSSSYSPPMAKAPEHILLMNPRCASLHDALRTGPSRGLSSATLSEMRSEYSRECDEEESRARSQLSRQSADKREQERESQRQQQAVSNQAKASAELCGELKRVIKTKKARTDLTDGEKRDLERTEQNYIARCQ